MPTHVHLELSCSKTSIMLDSAQADVWDGEASTSARITGAREDVLLCTGWIRKKEYFYVDDKR